MRRNGRPRTLGGRPNALANRARFAYALIGGALGCALASTLHGYSTSTSNLQSFSEVAFAFSITPEIIGASMAFALTMGILGGLLLAVRAAGLPIAEAVREDC